MARHQSFPNLKKSKAATPVSPSLEKRLLAYAGAATAAGVSVLSFVQSAEAEIIYTPADIHIHVNGGIVTLDLNHDETTDVSFEATFRKGTRTSGGYLKMFLQATEGEGVIQTVSQNNFFAAALPNGRRIGPGDAFGNPVNMCFGGYATFGGTITAGPWRSPTERGYLGLRFAIKGKTHYAWVRVRRVASTPFHYPAVITGYAYETIPGKAILTGQTLEPDEVTAQPDASRGSLGSLALGPK